MDGLGGYESGYKAGFAAGQQCVEAPLSPDKTGYVRVSASALCVILGWLLEKEKPARIERAVEELWRNCGTPKAINSAADCLGAVRR